MTFILRATSREARATEVFQQLGSRLQFGLLIPEMTQLFSLFTADPCMNSPCLNGGECQPSSQEVIKTCCSFLQLSCYVDGDVPVTSTRVWSGKQRQRKKAGYLQSGALDFKGPFTLSSVLSSIRDRNWDRTEFASARVHTWVNFETKNLPAGEEQGVLSSGAHLRVCSGSGDMADDCINTLQHLWELWLKEHKNIVKWRGKWEVFWAEGKRFANRSFSCSGRVFREVNCWPTKSDRGRGQLCRVHPAHDKRQGFYWLSYRVR